MKAFSGKLILIRGNSGSGKSTIAKTLRDQAIDPSKIALVEQDYLRRIVLKEKEKDGANNISLIKEVAIFALSHGYDVLLEGIFYSKRYSAMLMKLMKIAPNHFVYYLDVSLEETLRRHLTKPDSHEFGETEIRSWYRNKDYLGTVGETIIKETSSLESTVKRILKDTGI